MTRNSKFSSSNLVSSRFRNSAAYFGSSWISVSRSRAASNQGSISSSRASLGQVENHGLGSSKALNSARRNSALAQENPERTISNLQRMSSKIFSQAHRRRTSSGRDQQARENEKKDSNSVRNQIPQKGTIYKLIDFGTATGILNEDGETLDLIMTISEIKFAGTPAYSSPESFNDPKNPTVLSDIWSLAITLFHITTGQLPFSCPDAMTAAVNIARDLDSPVPDVRDSAPENLRISADFANVICKGMQKRTGNRFRNVDEMATALHGCLVRTGNLFYSAYISCQYASERYHALMLYDILNNTLTPAGNRVIVYFDFKQLESNNWEESLASGLMNSLVALPLLSAGVIESLASLSGSDNDPPNRIAQELTLMNVLNNHKSILSLARLETIFPILVGRPLRKNEQNYPCSGNFFTDGSNANVKRLSRRVSNAIVNKVHHVLKKHYAEFDEDFACPIADTIKDLFSVQGAQLWNHGPLAAERITEDSELWGFVSTKQSEPPLDLAQLGMLKAELRALVPAIHEVIDRAHTSSTMRLAVAAAAAERRKMLMAKVLKRMVTESLADMFQSWAETAQEARMYGLLQHRMRNLQGNHPKCPLRYLAHLFKMSVLK